ncbi:13835_t:CDS:2, partial [Funneliformis mosseae]
MEIVERSAIASRHIYYPKFQCYPVRKLVPLRKAKTVRAINVRINVGIEPTRKTRNTRNS